MLGWCVQGPRFDSQLGRFFSLQFLGLWPMAADKKIAERIRRFTVAVTVEISYIFVIIDKLYAN